jgi:hypothetical protein
MRKSLTGAALCQGTTKEAAEKLGELGIFDETTHFRG